MMSVESELAAADRLRREHAARLPFSALAVEQRQDMNFALAVQDVSIRRWLEAGHVVAGWKIGLTSKRMQDMCGVAEPVMGAILGGGVRSSPARLRCADHGRLGLETELAVRLGSVPGPGEPSDAQALYSRVDGFAAAFEVIDDRNADYAALDACSLVADNSWNAGVILGEARTMEPDASLLGRMGRLSCNGAPAGEGLTDAAGGDPLLVVSWLISALRARGRSLQPGQWVLTGSVMPTVFPKPGETYRFEIDGFAPIEAIIE
ncbi:MAG: 2-keto-4-pentenoate hydratase [Sphingobium sp.]